MVGTESGLPDAGFTRHSMPWGRPRRELLLLALVAVAALSSINFVAPNGPHVCLADALIHGRLTADSCLEPSFDKARYHGHLYSDKAPGLGIIQAPAVAILQPEHHSGRSADVRSWIVDVLSVGIALLACAWLLGRVAEGLSPGYGGMALVLFALGTLVFPLAAVGFNHIPAAAVAFGAFLLAWNRRPGLAGVAAGAAVLLEYEAGLVVVILGIYVALGGWRRAAIYLAGTAPAAFLLGAYNWAAFGVPWNLSYRYVDNIFASEQKAGFFGIGRPHIFGIERVFAGDRGLLAVSPVLLMAAYGLVVLGRRYTSEAIVAGTVTALFVAVNASYFLPYGGDSPGPRFLVVALPFLGLGLGPALAARPVPTLILGAVSVAAMTAVSLVWNGTSELRNGVWGELARVPVERGSSRFVTSLPSNALSFVGPGKVWGALVVVVCATAAFVVALGAMPLTRRAHETARASVVPAILLTAVAAAVLTANIFTLTNYPYGTDPERVARVHTSISVSGPTSIRPGDQLRVSATGENGKLVGLSGVVLEIGLSPGLRLAAEPTYTRGSGCTGTTTLVCNLDSLSPSMSTAINLIAQVTGGGPQRITATTTADGDVTSNHASAEVVVSPARQ
jgi:hypothetical protein